LTVEPLKKANPRTLTESPLLNPGTAFDSKLLNHSILHRFLGFGSRFGDGEELDSYKAPERLKVDQSLGL
jgi:hypothetical protein